MTTLESNDSVELYNMADDIGERNNLASAQTATRDELLGDLLAWIESTEAKFASEPNLDYDANAHKQADAAQKKKGNRRKK
jgi:hypothetical protein